MTAMTPATQPPQVFDPQPSAHWLSERWANAEQVDALPEVLRPHSLEQGYAIQQAQIADQKTIGWKLGVGSPIQLRSTSLERPLIGQLLAHRCFAHNAPESTAPTGIPAEGVLTIEVELAVRLTRDFAPDETGPVTLADISDLLFTIEVVRSRFYNRRGVGWPSFVADNVGFEALAIAPSLGLPANPQVLASLNADTHVYLDGEIIALPLTGDNAVDPLSAVNYLVQHARVMGIHLHKGQLVSTGAYCQPFDLPERGHQIRVEALGKQWLAVEV